ncbi:energy coupling factor transporter S component ThiW [Oribacterium sp. WCC10]|uniref:energy coupling factor transporter S component ThiW n=1 Tax=Oribacterium sp. WCC10 TaxID=1855343 RepID=UPI0008F333AB|nr:energy coupling factor transporter S component ThiW [Oribacterium sp. WCC10]SFG21320.1 energy coupling factor transporter S component ThiW [Oribacterium sp. WCC10]
MDNLKKETLEMNVTSGINTKKLALAAFFAAVAVVGSTFSIPVFGSKCSPVQHLVNVLCAIFLGPGYGIIAAFTASVLRNLMGLGSLLAFPGSMCGAFLSGIMYKYFKKLPAAYIGEVFGTGIIGGMLSYPVSAFVMGNSAAGVFTFVIPFLISTIGGTFLAIIITMALKQIRMIERAKDILESK